MQFLIYKTLLLLILSFISVFTLGLASNLWQEDRPVPGDSGPYERVLQVNRGPYSIVIWQSPERAIVGTVRFIVELHDISGNPIDSALVTLYGSHLSNGSRPQSAHAINTPMHPYFYYSFLELEHAGQWNVRFEIEGPDGKLPLDMLVDVSSRSRSGSFVQPATWLFIGLQGALIGGVLLIWYQGKKRRQNNQQSS